MSPGNGDVIGMRPGRRDEAGMWECGQDMGMSVGHRDVAETQGCDQTRGCQWDTGMSPGHGGVPRLGAEAVSLQFLLDIARQKNQTPLPLIKPYSGPRLPPDRYCLTAPNYRLKSLQKKVRMAQGLGVHPWGDGRGCKLRLSTALKGEGEYWPVHARSEVSRLDL